jgi:hypothetical protein
MIIKPGYAGMSFELPDDAIIADIGSGHNPLPQATYCIEKGLPDCPFDYCKRNLEPVKYCTSFQKG